MPYQPFATETIFRINRLERFVVVEGDNILNMINMLFMAEGYHSLLNLKAITKLKSRDGISRGSGEGVAGGNPPPMLGKKGGSCSKNEDHLVKIAISLLIY